MIIREYKPEDREGIEECILTLQNLEYRLEPHYWAKPKLVVSAYFDYLIKKSENGRGTIFVADTDSVIAGIAAVRIEETSPCAEARQQIYISDLAVLEKFQGKGIGAMLLAKTEEFAKAKAFDFIYLDVTSTNDPAIKFYDDHGYIKRQIMMEKKLN